MFHIWNLSYLEIWTPCNLHERDWCLWEQLAHGYVSGSVVEPDARTVLLADPRALRTLRNTSRACARWHSCGNLDDCVRWVVWTSSCRRNADRYERFFKTVLGAQCGHHDQHCWKCILDIHGLVLWYSEQSIKVTCVMYVLYHARHIHFWYRILDKYYFIFWLIQQPELLWVFIHSLTFSISTFKYACKQHKVWSLSQSI